MTAAHNKNDQTMEPISEGRASEAASAGALLRNARQQRGLHIAALAVMLKVPQAKLEALEADRFDLLPDATFARALATAMCRALKVDPAPVLALLPRTNDRQFDVRPGLNQPFRERGAGPSDAGLLALAVRPVVWGPALLLIAAAAVYWIPAGWLPERDATAPSASGVVAAASMPVVEFVPAPAAPEPAASAPIVGAASIAGPVASAPPQVRDVVVPAALATASAPAATPAAAGGSDLRITAVADTWIEVVDARGQMLLSRVLPAGEQQAFGGAAPYKVRVGNVSGTRVEWRGAAVDLSAQSSNNIARLELK
ncbi:MULTISPECIES: helix-turn-helix domain-containing protein [unclassified Roseateles]|uniref:helix-turn-helix domain-containing protein n=1 Tax=unclassified Roseateles TaxID=2626991 RepID=UPI0006F8C9EB|nr:MULTISPECIES: helix-turn-helix domain-containing protein [unclassified Roseateles]KQW44748.1 hypothetical protein ASC81_14285 [Pelomonas sp. Root405]KRA70107.1 hypothetical protein ASD88_18445 [Pelomonas sp. Root662]